LTSLRKRRKRSASYKSFNACKKNKPGGSGRRNWNGCTPHLPQEVVPIAMTSRIIYWGKNAWINFSLEMKTRRLEPVIRTSSLSNMPIPSETLQPKSEKIHCS